MVAAFGWAKAFMPNGPNAARHGAMAMAGFQGCRALFFLGDTFIYIYTYIQSFIYLFIDNIYLFISFIFVYCLYTIIYIFICCFFYVFIYSIFFVYYDCVFYMSETPRFSVL